MSDDSSTTAEGEPEMNLHLARSLTQTHGVTEHGRRDREIPFT